MDLLPESHREKIIHRRSWRRDEMRRTLKEAKTTGEKPKTNQEETTEIFHLLIWSQLQHNKLAEDSRLEEFSQEFT